MRHPAALAVPTLAVAAVLAAAPAHAITFTPGDLVISLYGDGANDGTYADNAASPITLKQITTTGADAGSLVLPQTTTVVNGTTQYAISGEYGSSSEGSLTRSVDGKSLVIAGYGVAASDYNGPNGIATYGGTKGGAPALAQTTSIPGGQYTAVPRVVALIGADGSVDTSTGLYNVFNGNNPRSVATVNGSSFYLGGQGVSGDVTQGIQYATKGASSATAINTTSDFRTVELVNGQLYASRDYNGPSGTQDASINKIGTGTPTTAATATDLSGIGPSITLSAKTANGVNNSRIGTTVYLSPENYFFANPTTLYIADSGNPKNGNTGKAQLGEGGLQKWTFNGANWVFDYDIYAGLGLVSNASGTTAVTDGTSGLIGLVGTVSGNNVYLYATNATLGDTDQTYVFDVDDSLSNTDPTVGSAETFQTLFTAPSDTNVRGISFAPIADSVAVPEPASAAILAGLAGLAVLLRRKVR